MSVNVRSVGRGDDGDRLGEQRAGIQRQLRAIVALIDSNDVPHDVRAELRRLADDNDTPPTQYLAIADELFQNPSVKSLRSAVVEPVSGDRGGDPITFAASGSGRMPVKVRWNCTENGCGSRDLAGDQSGPFDARCGHPRTSFARVP